MGNYDEGSFYMTVFVLSIFTGALLVYLIIVFNKKIKMHAEKRDLQLEGMLGDTRPFRINKETGYPVTIENEGE